MLVTCKTSKFVTKETLQVLPQTLWHLMKMLINFISLRGASVADVGYRVRTGPGKPGKSWNFILAFSRTGKSWKKTAGPGKCWKSVKIK